jgi:hypothetical protein
MPLLDRSTPLGTPEALILGTADWSRAIVRISFASSLDGSRKDSHGSPSPMTSRAGTYTTPGDVTPPSTPALGGAANETSLQNPDGRTVGVRRPPGVPLLSL